MSRSLLHLRIICRFTRIKHVAKENPSARQGKTRMCTAHLRKHEKKLYPLPKLILHTPSQRIPFKQTDFHPVKRDEVNAHSLPCSGIKNYTAARHIVYRRHNPRSPFPTKISASRIDERKRGIKASARPSRNPRGKTKASPPPFSTKPTFPSSISRAKTKDSRHARGRGNSF